MKLRWITGAVLTMLVVVPSALAAGSAGTSYGGPGAVENEVNQGAAGVAASGGSLPFTGLDLALLVMGGLVLLLLGATLRRAARRGT